MEFCGKQPIPIIQAVERLQDASAQLGMTGDDVVTLLASGITIADLLEHVEAMVLNRVD
jgi:hypothetical protein